MAEEDVREKTTTHFKGGLVTGSNKRSNQWETIANHRKPPPSAPTWCWYHHLTSNFESLLQYTINGNDSCNPTRHDERYGKPSSIASAHKSCGTSWPSACISRYGTDRSSCVRPCVCSCNTLYCSNTCSSLTLSRASRSPELSQRSSQRLVSSRRWPLPSCRSAGSLPNTSPSCRLWRFWLIWLLLGYSFGQTVFRVEAFGILLAIVCFLIDGR